MIRVRVRWEDGRRRALYIPPPNGQIAPQRADPTVDRGAGGRLPSGQTGRLTCPTGRGRASPCWGLSREVPVLVPRATIAAQARPGL